MMRPQVTTRFWTRFWTASFAFVAFAAHAASQECTPANNYLDTQLRDPASQSCPDCGNNASSDPFSSLDGLVRDTRDMAIADHSLPLACFQSVMENRPSASTDYRYGVCDSATSRPQFRKGGHLVPAPCVNTGLLQAVQSAFAETTECTGVDQKEVFATFGWESRFQPNIASARGINSEGLAQLNSIATYDVDLMHRFSEDEDKPQCKQFDDIFKESDARRVGRQKHIPECSLISGSEGVLRNLLYGEVVYRYFKRIADKRVSSLKCAPGDCAKISTDLARQMYNGGESYLSQIFHFMVLRQGKRPMTYAQYKARFPALVLAHFEKNSDGSSVDVTRSEEARLAEAKRSLGYPNKIQKAIIQPLIQQGLGAECVDR
jgi:hypothetical protein